MDFSKKWLRKHEKFLLHFLIHIDLLMLCSKFELIPTSIFQVIFILRKSQKSEKYLRLYSPWIFKKMAPKTRKFFITFSYTYTCTYVV